MIQVDKTGDTTRIRVEGDMTIYAAAQLKDELLRALAGEKDAEMDLSDVAEIDTSGVQLLLLCKQEAQRQGHQLRLAKHSTAVLDIVDLYNLAAYFGDPLVLSRAA